MARTLSWIDRIVPIARTVAESTRSHYGRQELQRLFEIQPRSAQNLMAAMPLIAIGSAYLVEKEELIALLRHLNEAQDPTKAFSLLRTKSIKVRQRKLRALSLREVSADLDQMPANFILTRGEMTIRFASIDQLAEGMVYLATLLQHNLDDFAARYEPPAPSLEGDTREEEEKRLDRACLDRFQQHSSSYSKTV